MSRKSKKIHNQPEFLTSRRQFLTSGGIAAAALMTASIPAQAGTKTQEDMKNVQWLFVQSAHDASLTEDKLLLAQVSPMTIFFSDRPKRMSGHMTTSDFVHMWHEDRSKTGFTAVPPNAALSVFEENEVVEVVLEIMNPALNGADLHYDIKSLGGELPQVSGPCSLFIDPYVSKQRSHRRVQRKKRHINLH